VIVGHVVEVNNRDKVAKQIAEKEPPIVL